MLPLVLLPRSLEGGSRQGYSGWEKFPNAVFLVID